MVRSIGKIDVFYRSLDLYDLLEALGTPSMVCARVCVPRGRTRKLTVPDAFRDAEVELLWTLALLELSRRPGVERQASKSAYCRAHVCAPFENPEGGWKGGVARRRKKNNVEGSWWTIFAPSWSGGVEKRGTRREG